jgi:choline-sulfatase
VTTPNILFVLTDQQRWDALGVAGGWVNTPNLDRLAEQGVRFSNCITTTPICVPARVTMALGRYPHNTGVWNNVPYTLSTEANNWMRVIRNLGYRTSMFGKTHLHPHQGDLREKEYLLHDWGIYDVDEIGGPRASAWLMSHMTAMWAEKGLLEAYRADFDERFSHKHHVARPSTLPLEDYADVYIGQKAKTYLQAYDRDQPWFCWVSFGGPHEPWDAPEPYASMYNPGDMPDAVQRPVDHHARPQGWLDYHMAHNSPTFEENDIGAMRANYAGNVTLIDDQVGQILEVIEARGEMDNTIIVFTSDHGEMNGDWGLIYKMNFLDGALRVPLIVNTPDTRLAEGLVNDSPAENCDVGPTMVELAGGTLDYQQFAKSLCTSLGGAEHREHALSEFQGEFMLMTRSWKMAINRHGQPYLLFDRTNDPYESANLAGLSDYKSVEDSLRLRILERISESQLKKP